MFFELQKQRNKAENIGKEKVIFCLMSLDPLYFYQLYLVFFIHFEQFQRLQMHYPKFYKTCLSENLKKQ
jgi:hypothetical protein